VVEARRQLRLLHEHPDEGRLLGQVREDPFDDEDALEAGRALDAALVHFRHSSAADALEECVLPKLNGLGE
jgi:hypothetical protein